MKIGIIGAMPQEIKVLNEQMKEKTTWQEADAIFTSGKIDNHEVVVVESGIGKVLAAVTATLLISHYHVDILLNTGSAGGIGEGLAIGDIVISNRLAYHDADVTAFGYSMGQMPGMPLYYEADPQLIKTIEVAAESQGLHTKTGLIVSGDSFISSANQIAQIKQYFPDALASEMEGAAIAQVAYRYHVPVVVVRAMSDVGDENANVNFDDFIDDAGVKSANMVISFLKNL